MEAMFGVPFAPRVANIEPDLIRALKGLNLPMVSGQIGSAGIEVEPPGRAPLTGNSPPGSRDYRTTVREFRDRGAEGAA
jgi:hypothetical protein